MKGAKILVLGLAYKRDVDDLRESPYVILAEKLIGRGYDLVIFDRSVNMAGLLGANRAYIEREIPHIERLLASSPAAALEGTEIVIVGHANRDDRAALLAGLDGQTVIDLSGMADLQAHPRITYQGLCW